MLGELRLLNVVMLGINRRQAGFILVGGIIGVEHHPVWSKSLSFTILFSVSFFGDLNLRGIHAQLQFFISLLHCSVV